MTQEMTDHDQDFKNLIVDYPREAIGFLAAQEAASIDESARVLPIRQEQLKEHLRHHYRELDTPLLIEWSNGARGRPWTTSRPSSTPQSRLRLSRMRESLW